MANVPTIARHSACVPAAIGGFFLLAFFYTLRAAQGVCVTLILNNVQNG